MNSNYAIKFWAEDDRPREKLLIKGRSSLSNAELLAIILATGYKRKSALELAKELLHEVDNDLNLLAKMNYEELIKFKGVGQVKAITLLACFELVKRKTALKTDLRPKIISSSITYELLKPYLLNLIREEFYILFLNRANRLISCEQISTGGYKGTVVDAKLVFKRAIDLKSEAIVLAHNHPSGTLRPSDEDISLTKSMKEMGKLLQIIVIDHLIFTDFGYFSFSDNGIL